MADISSQLSRLFAQGVAESPSLAAALYDNLPSHGGQNYTKAEADYHKATGDEGKCSQCEDYSKGKCSKVSGQIDGNHTCSHFEPKKMATEAVKPSA